VKRFASIKKAVEPDRDRFAALLTCRSLLSCTALTLSPVRLSDSIGHEPWKLEHFCNTARVILVRYLAMTIQKAWSKGEKKPGDAGFFLAYWIRQQIASLRSPS
jgi:hypothetical protein